MKQRRKTRRSKLTKTELAHLKETHARTRGDVKANVEAQDRNEFPCWICVGIGRKLDM